MDHGFRMTEHMNVYTCTEIREFRGIYCRILLELLLLIILKNTIH